MKLNRIKNTQNGCRLLFNQYHAAYHGQPQCDGKFIILFKDEYSESGM